MKNSYLILSAVLILLASCGKESDKDTFDASDKADRSESYQDVTKNSADTLNKSRKVPQIVITHTAIVKTSSGTFEIALYGKDAPNTVENFTTLAKRGFYNGILFHRVAKNFVIQAGDPLTKNPKMKSDWGSGGESIFGSGFETELNPKSQVFKTGYAKGVLAMANRGPGTNTSQFFICLNEAQKLEKEWTIFGRVTKGMETVDAISAVETEPSPRGKNDGIPKTPVVILDIKVKKETK